MSVAGSRGNQRASTSVTTVTESKPHVNLESKASTVANRVTNQSHAVAPTTTSVSFVRSLSSGTTTQTTSSGAVRKLFVTPTTQPGKTQPSSQVKCPTTSSGKLVRSNSKVGDSDPKVSTSHPAPTNKQMSYSRIIASQDNRAEVIEQPVQQILKTPTIFQEPATQLSKPRKISTYSDAVGKRHQGTVGGEAVRLGTSYSQAQPQGNKLNLAPGSRPIASNNAESSDKVIHTSDYLICLHTCTCIMQYLKQDYCLGSCILATKFLFLH